MTKNKKLKNKKRYLGNPLMVAFLPVLASAGLTLGATSLSMKTSSSEVFKAHDIDVEHPTGDWTLKVYTEDGTPITKAVKGETVIFKAFEPTHKNNIDNPPTAIRINGKEGESKSGATYKLDKNMEAKVVVTFIEKMTVEFLYPQAEDQHDVVFDLGYKPEGEKPQTYTLSVIHNRFIDSPFTPVRENYEFDGWYENESKFDFEHTAITEDHTLVAHWNDGQARIPHKISLTQPTGTDKDCWELSCTHTQASLGDTVTFTVVNPKAAITHWYPRAININGQLFELTPKPAENKYTATVTIPFKVNMNASIEFVDNPYETFIVTFDAKGADKLVLSQIRSKYDKVKKPADPTKNGFEFAGWFYNDEGTERKWDFDNQVFNNINLYAKWTAITYDVTFKAAGADPAEQKIQNKQYGDIITTGVTIPTKTDPTGAVIYKFKGWQRTDSTELGIQPVTGNNEYNAVWEETAATYTVTFDLNGGHATTNPPQQVVQYGQYATKPDEDHTPILDKYHDKAVWYADGETEPFDFEKTPIKSNLLLHAKYAPKSYTIKFNNWDGTPFVPEQTVEYNNLPTVPTDTPTKELEGHDCVFAGWKNEETSSGVVPAIEDATYTAQFNDIPKTYIVKVDLNGGSGDIPTAIPVKYNQTFSISNPTPPSGDYYFNGWFKDETFTTEFVPGEDVVTGDMTLHAEYKPTDTDESLLNIHVEATGIVSIDGYKDKTTRQEVLSLQNKYNESNIDEVLGFGALEEYQDTTLKEVYLPKKAHALNTNAFGSCTNLSTINTRNIELFGEHCLEKTLIDKFIISGKTHKFMNNVFDGCAALTTVDFTEYTSESPKLDFSKATELFKGCTALNAVTLPNRISIPENGVALAKGMFSGCTSLSAIWFEGTWKEWKNIVASDTAKEWHEGSSITSIWCYNNDMSSVPEEHNWQEE